MSLFAIARNPKTQVRALQIVIIMLGLLLFALQVFAFDEKVEFVLSLKKLLAKPVDVAVSSFGNVYVLDELTSEIVTFDPDGKFQAIFGSRGSKFGQMRRPHSLAVSPQGEIVVADTGNHRIQVFGTNGEFLFSFGSFGIKRGEFHSPQAVAIDNAGFIYVADTENQRLQSFTPKGVLVGELKLGFRPVDVALDQTPNLYILNKAGGKIVKFDAKGQKLKELEGVMNRRNYLGSAAGIAVDERGDIYFSEGLEHSMKKIGDDGALLLSFGSEGTGLGQFRNPIGITVDTRGQIYISDADNQRALVFQVSGSRKPFLPREEPLTPLVEYDSNRNTSDSIVDIRYVIDKGLYALSDKGGHILFNGDASKMFGSSGRNEGEFRSPMAIDVTRDGELFVADSGNNRLQILQPDGRQKMEFGQNGVKTGQFLNPQGVAVNSKGNIYVADSKNNRIQIFNNSGIFLKAFGATSRTVKSAGQDVGHFRFPKSLTIDSRDRVYVSDFENDRIQVFDEDGAFIKEIGRTGSQIGELSQPVDVAIDEKDYLYVADRGNNRVQIFDPDGRWVGAFGSYGAGPGYFPQLTGVTAAEGKIYVSNYGLDQIKVFSFDSARYERQKLLKLVQTEPDSVPEALPSETVETAPPLPAVTSEVTVKDRPQEPLDEDLKKIVMQEIQKINGEPVSEPEPQPVDDIADAPPAAQPEIARVRDRLYVTKTFYLPPNFDVSNEQHSKQVRLATRFEAVKELAEKLGVSESFLLSYTKIEEENFIDNEFFKMTVSAPKNIPRER